MCLFFYFSFERNYDVLKSKSPCILLNKNINFNKKQNGIKNGKSYTHLERDEPCALSHKRIELSWNWRKKNEGIF